MKQNTTLFAGLLLAAGIAIAPGLTASAKTLKAAHYLPPKHPIGIGYQTFADELKKDTGGSLTVRIFPGESLLGAKAISDGVRDGVADIGFDTMTYTPAYYPHGILLNDLAMIGENDFAAAFAATELYLLHCKPCLDEFRKQNQVFISGVSTGPYVIIAKSDMNSPDKIKGKKLRAGGALWDRWAQFAGGTGVNIPTSEMYEGLSRGILDGAIYAVGGLKTHGLADVSGQVVMLNLGAFRSGNLYSFNRDVWSKLTKEQRQAVFKAASVALVKTVEEYHKGDDEGLAMAKQKNIPVVKPDPGLLRLKAAFIEKDTPQVIENANKQLGISDAAEFVGEYRKLLDKWEKIVAPIEGDHAKLADAFYQEVYAKLDPATYEVK